MYRDRYKTTWWYKFLCCELVNRAHKYLCPCTRLSMSYRLNNWLGNGLGDPIWLRWPKYENHKSFIYPIRQQIGNVARNSELRKLCEKNLVKFESTLVINELPFDIFFQKYWKISDTWLHPPQKSEVKVKFRKIIKVKKTLCAIKISFNFYLFTTLW